MNFYVLQSVLAVRNTEEEPWYQLLVPVIMVVLWVLAGLTKAKSKKQKDLDIENMLTPKPATEQQRVYVNKFLKNLEIKPKTVTETDSLQLKNKIADIKPDIKQPTDKPVRTGKYNLNLDSSKQLKRAILYHEIFDKPLALKD